LQRRRRVVDDDDDEDDDIRQGEGDEDIIDPGKCHLAIEVA